jgi:glycosyltransferase involved in cell wall biosynthesis
MAPGILLLTTQLHAAPTGGRELLCKLNHDVLRELYGERLVVYQLPKRPVQGLAAIVKAFKGHIDGIDGAALAEVLRIVREQGIGQVFIDGSNLGAFAKALKQQLPQVRSSTFFHNVEARFFAGALRQFMTPRAVAVLAANYLAERNSVRHSDQIICLSERDSRLLARIYGRGATHVSAMALRDQRPDAPLASPLAPERTSPQRFALFVGGAFYANRSGISWFVKHVAPRIGIKLCIVGKGFDDLRSELQSEGRVEVVGAVDSLAQWYADAEFVVAPIFDGSGMKTKVAEALMFGKRIIGTPEAFSGYEDIVDRAGASCATVEEFVSAIAAEHAAPGASFDPALRELYEQRYSLPALRSRLARILA